MLICHVITTNPSSHCQLSTFLLSNSDICDVGMLSHFSCVQLLVTLWIVAHQTPLSMGFSRQEYWSGLPCPSLGDLPHPGIKPRSLMSPALAGGFFITSTTTLFLLPSLNCSLTFLSYYSLTGFSLGFVHNCHPGIIYFPQKVVLLPCSFQELC